MKITLKSIYIFVLLFLPALTYSAGNTYYVTQTGSGDPISVAEFNALGGTGYAGDTFYFSGTFSTRITINISGTSSVDGSNDVKLDGWEGGVCTPLSVDCSSSANLGNGLTINTGKAYLDIQDFRITSATSDNTVQIWQNVNHVRFKKNLIYDAGGRSYNHTCLSGRCEYFVIEENRLRNFARLANSVENFNFDYTRYMLVKNNWVSMEAGFSNYCNSCNIAAAHKCDNVLVENNDFHDGYGIEPNSTGWAIKETGPSSNFIFRFNKFHGATFAGLTQATAAHNPRVNDIYIYGNFLYDNDEYGSSAYYYADNVYWWSNLFVENGRAGIVLWTNPGLDAPTDTYTYNNTFSRNGDFDPQYVNRGGWVVTAGTNHVLKNNIFYNNKSVGTYGYDQTYDTTNAAMEHNTLYHSEDRGANVVDPGFTDPDGADNIHGTVDDDYTLTGSGNTDGADLSKCFSVDLSGGDAWMEAHTGYGRYIEPCIDDALDPNGTDWTTTPPTVKTVKRDTAGWSRGAYAYTEIREDEEVEEVEETGGEGLEKTTSTKDTTPPARPNPRIESSSN